MLTHQDGPDTALPGFHKVPLSRDAEEPWTRDCVPQHAVVVEVSDTDFVVVEAQVRVVHSKCECAVASVSLATPLNTHDPATHGLMSHGLLAVLFQAEWTQSIVGKSVEVKTPWAAHHGTKDSTSLLHAP